MGYKHRSQKVIIIFIAKSLLRENVAVKPKPCTISKVSSQIQVQAISH